MDKYQKIWLKVLLGMLFIPEIIWGPLFGLFAFSNAFLDLTVPMFPKLYHSTSDWGLLEDVKYLSMNDLLRFVLVIQFLGASLSGGMLIKDRRVLIKIVASVLFLIALYSAFIFYLTGSEWFIFQLPHEIYKR